MAYRRQVKLSKKEVKYRLKVDANKAANVRVGNKLTKGNIEKKIIKVPQVVPIRRLAELIQTPVNQIIQALYNSGVKVTINESIDFETTIFIWD